MTYPTTLTAAGTYDITSQGSRIESIKISNIGAGSVYYGDLPGGGVRRDVVGLTGESTLLLENESAGLAIQVGMLASDEDVHINPAAEVLAVNGRVVTLAGTLSGDLTGNVTFLCPDIGAANGHPISPGETQFHDGTEGGLQHGLRIVADATGTVLVLTVKRA